MKHGMHMHKPNGIFIFILIVVSMSSHLISSRSTSVCRGWRLRGLRALSRC